MMDIAPTAVMAAGTMGAGAIASFLLAGTWFRYDLLWVILLMLPVFVVSADSASRIGALNPDRGLFTVVLVGEKGSRVGELDEEMVFETRPGDNVTLGASTWHVEAITRDRVIVTPAPGEPGRLPFWRGEGPGRPIELGRAIGAFLREAGQLDEARMRAWLADATPLDDSEFTNEVSTNRQTMDLLTVVMHELGHTAGLADLYDVEAEDDLMYALLKAGERRTPNEAVVDRLFASFD